MSKYLDMAEKAGELLSAASSGGITDQNRVDAALAGAQVAATLAVAESIQDLVRAVQHLEGGLTV